MVIVQISIYIHVTAVICAVSEVGASNAEATSLRILMCLRDQVITVCRIFQYCRITAAAGNLDTLVVFALRSALIDGQLGTPQKAAAAQVSTARSSMATCGRRIVSMLIFVTTLCLATVATAGVPDSQGEGSGEPAPLQLLAASAQHYCPALLPSTTAQHYCPALLPSTTAQHYCPARLGHPVHTAEALLDLVQWVCSALYAVTAV